METQQATAIAHAATPHGLSAYRNGVVLPDQYHRAQVCALVSDLLSAARCGKVDEYLRPIPITRLHMAQRACLEIGAIHLASALHATQFSLTRVGVRVPFAQAVSTLTAVLAVHSEDVDHLVAQYLSI